MAKKTNLQLAHEPAPARRCAIYTRKSSSEGLEMDFNSLDAQRDACEAYIKSQRCEGWGALPERYDDGGYTGGNMDRPAFQRLMADIEAGRIDCVVVYKVDRLSRSLMDFARIMETFEKHKVSFVSVTQSFDTGTSMGRLMLNVLLSFAQFEREIISERTRDKIAAARRKGKWSGGYPILGYDIDEKSRRLVVNEFEAGQVRKIFEMYLRNQALLPTVEELNRMGWNTKTWETKKGNSNGGAPFNKPRLHRLLTNIAYIGKVRHKDNVYEGEHEAIVDENLWNKVQAVLRNNRQNGGAAVKNKLGALLSGLVRCGSCGCAMVHSFTVKKGKYYRYYICSNAQKNGWKTCPTKTVSAPELEEFVVERIRGMGTDPELVEATIASVQNELQKKKPGLLAEKHRLERDIQKTQTESRRLVDALGRGTGESSRIIAGRLSEMEGNLDVMNRRLTQIKEELIQLEMETVDRREVVQALEHFNPIWGVLYPREKARIMRLLIESITYNAQEGTVEIVLHPGGIKQLAAEMKCATGKK